MDTLAFLKTVITTPEGYFNLAIGHPKGGEWDQLWYEWPKDIEKIVEVAQQYSQEDNVYFSAHLFSEKKAIKGNVLPSRTIQADLDDAVIPVVNVPNIIVETSPNRHQGFWIIESSLNNSELEALSKQVTYSILDADRSGWSLGHKMRIPGTLNHKYNTGPKAVHVISANIRPYATLKPIVVATLEDIPSTDEWSPATLKSGPRELWAEIRQSLPRRVQGQYDIRQQDRSTALWGLMTSLFRLSLDRDAVFHIARESANNKFKDNKYHGDLDLQKDVLRAERAIKSGQDDVSNIKTRINDIRRLPGLQAEKRAYIAAVVQDAMSQQGNFVATNDGQEWFIREDTGRPIVLTTGSEYMNSFLEMRYGLNPTEQEQKYLLFSLMSYTKENGIKGSTASMSHFNTSQQLMLLHTGRRDVLHIDANNISTIANGNLNIVFPWREDEEPFVADTDHSIGIDSLFEGCFDNLNLSEMSPKEALAILKAWLYFIFFRDDAMGRPILALFGQPGCLSKDTLLNIKRGSHSPRLFTIAQAHKAFHGRWDSSISTKLLSEKDGVIEWKDVKDIFPSGHKVVYDVRFSNREHFKASAEHRFLTPNGYKELKDLSVGDKVVIKGEPLGGNGNRIVNALMPHSRRVIAADYHPFARKKLVNGYGPYGNILYCRAVVEAHLNNLSIHKYLTIVHTQKDRVNELEYLPEDVIFHHKDENPENDSYENIVVLTKAEHDRLHGFSNQRNLGAYSGIFTSDIAEILSIEEVGTEPTYDIEMMDDTQPNYVVGGVVTHNSGKSTLMRRIYTLLYGPQKAVASITSQDDFDHIVSQDPLVVFDNVDTWVSWLPDKLAIMAAPSDLKKRKLYTNTDTITLRRQAIIAITAHNPKFRREDIVDRLLIISLHRLKEFRPEADLLKSIYKNRDKYWGGIVKDIQRILQTPPPLDHEIPKFRVSDFARIGLWVARALDFEADFIGALNRNLTEQVNYNLEEEDILVDTITEWIKRPSYEPRLYTIGELWNHWSTIARDPLNFTRLYKNSIVLGKKLWSLQDSLSSIFDIEFEFDARNARRWKITAK